MSGVLRGKFMLRSPGHDRPSSLLAGLQAVSAGVGPATTYGVPMGTGVGVGTTVG